MPTSNRPTDATTDQSPVKPMASVLEESSDPIRDLHDFFDQPVQHAGPTWPGDGIDLMGSDCCDD